MTEAEVRAAHLRDRRGEAAAELERIVDDARAASWSPPPEPLAGRRAGRRSRRSSSALRAGASSSAPSTRWPSASTSRRSRTSRASRPSARTSRRALAELQGLIRETDRKIAAAFEETFDATRRNFEELVEHLFPGGRGRLRLVDDRRGPKPVLGRGRGGRRRPSADPASPDAKPRRAGQ